MTPRIKYGSDDGRAWWGDSNSIEQGELVDQYFVTAVLAEPVGGATGRKWHLAQVRIAGGDQVLYPTDQDAINKRSASHCVTMYVRIRFVMGRIQARSFVIDVKEITQRPKLRAENPSAPKRDELFAEVQRWCEDQFDREQTEAVKGATLFPVDPQAPTPEQAREQYDLHQ